MKQLLKLLLFQHMHDFYFPFAKIKEFEHKETVVSTAHIFQRNSARIQRMSTMKTWNVSYAYLMYPFGLISFARKILATKK